jgi:hypothetical protein
MSESAPSTSPNASAAFDTGTVDELERIELLAWRDLCAAADRGSRLSCGVQVFEVAGAFASIASRVDVLAFNRVLGLGFAQPVTAAVVGEIVDRYAAAGAPRFFVQLAPGERIDETARALEEHGLAYFNSWVKLQRELPCRSVSDVAGIRIEKVGPRHAAVFSNLVVGAFDWPQQVAPWVAATVGRAGWWHYLAWRGDRPAGTAAMFTDGVAAWFGLAATLTEERRHGVQTALLARRLADAGGAGCRRAVVETAKQTRQREAPSYRNVRRAGFAVAYRRPNYLGRPGGGA